MSRSFPGTAQYLRARNEGALPGDHCVSVEGAAKFSSSPTPTVPSAFLASPRPSASAQKALGRRQNSASLGSQLIRSSL